MKKIALLSALILQSVISLYAQSLVSVAPDSALSGTTLYAQITGSNTLFQNSSPNDNVFGIYLQQGGNSVYANMTSLSIMDDSLLYINFLIPASANTGWYDLHLSYTDSMNPPNTISLSLANAVQIFAPTLFVQGTVFLDSDSNGVQNGGEIGLSGQQVLLQPDNQYAYTNGSGLYSFGSIAGNKTIQWVTNSGFMISAGSVPSYNSTISTTTGGFDFGLTNNGFQFTNIIPDTVLLGTQLMAVVSGVGLNLQNSSPQGIIDNSYLYNGTNYAYSVYGTINVLTQNSFSVTYSVPANTPPGFYSVYIQYYDSLGMIQQSIIPNGVQVLAPGLYINGTVFLDRDSDNVQSLTEAGVLNQQIVLQPDNQTFYTDNNGHFSLPTFSGTRTITLNVSGTYSLNPLSPTSYTSNFTGTANGYDFALLSSGPYLKSITPDSALAGTTLQATITGQNTLFLNSSPPNGSIYSAYLQHNNPYFNIYAIQGSIVVSDDTHFNADFPVVANAPTGLYDLTVAYIDSLGAYISMTLPNSVTIYQPQLFIEGTVFLDVDSNGVKGVNEPGLSNQRLTLQPDNQYVYTDQNGNYSVGSYAGTHTVAWNTPGSIFSLSPGSPATYTPTVSTTTGGFDFGLTAPDSAYSGDIISFYGMHRCNQNNYFYLSYHNTGYITYNARITVITSSNVSFVNGTPAPTSTNGDTTIWLVTGLQPWQYNYIQMTLHMPTAGSSVSVKGYFESLDVNGTVVFTDSLINAATVTCSFDPNDKSVTPAGVQASNYTLMNDTLEYLIQFQNTGTDTAFTVVIRDTLDNNLDMNTFELIDASSPVQTQLSQLTRVVTFTFNTILLPDSNTNELLSHGFVRYRIRAIQGLPAATAITNTANIYFDFNSPVATNSTLNTLVYVIPSAIVETDKIAKHATVIPNPFDGKAWLVFSNPAKEIYQLHIFSVAGKQVMKKVFADDKLLLQKENLSSGLYIYELTNVKTGDKMRGKFVIQ